MTAGRDNPGYDATSEEVKQTHPNRASQDGDARQVDIESQEAAPERKAWDSQWEFLMSCISLSVGLGNVWRFPVTAYQNGGGAFLIPYLIVLFVIGRPIYFLELTLGQFTSLSHIKSWRCTPIFKGVGYGSMIASFSILTYYVSIMGITVYYFIVSFAKTLPWSDCQESWAGEGNCFPNGTSNTSDSVSQMYFRDAVIKELPDIDNGVGNPDWKLTLCTFFSWALVFLIQIKGIQSAGKVAYFTAIFPYVVLLIILGRGVTLPGAGKGILYFIKPDFEKILDPNVWYAAVAQCFFSLNTGLGSLTMFGSFNPFRHNVYRDALVVSLMDTFTSLLAGFTIFAVLGNLAYELDTDIENVVQGGPGLVFVSYPEAIAKFPGVPQLFAVLFFLMLFTLGIGSAVSDAGAIVTVFCDRFPKLIRWQVTAVVCSLGFGVGVAYCTPGGMFLFDLVDFFGGGFVIYMTSALEVIGVAWIYGLYNYIDDMEFMLGMKLGWYWKICWGLVIPIFLAVILVYSLVLDITPVHNDVKYPLAALICGWMLSAVALGALPAGAIQAVAKVDKASLGEKFKVAVNPDPKWGPSNPKNRLAWEEFRKERPELTLWERIKQRKL